MAQRAFSKLPGAGPISPGLCLGRTRTLEVRLAHTEADIAACQELRYLVFYEELGALPGRFTKQRRRDSDRFDAVCDHLMVIDSDARSAPDGVVGTYRLLRQDQAQHHGGFSAQTEFDLEPLMARKAADTSFLELGRSCVLKTHRSKPAVELLWQGIWNYARLHEIDVLIGSAAFQGTDLDDLAEPLSYLHHNHLAARAWRVSALPERYEDMNRMAAGQINRERALRALPPLIKGYLRLGACIGDGAVADDQFNTTDVFVLLNVGAIGKRYVERFEAARARMTRAGACPSSLTHRSPHRGPVTA